MDYFDKKNRPKVGDRVEYTYFTSEKNNSHIMIQGVITNIKKDGNGLLDLAVVESDDGSKAVAILIDCKKI